jgi:glycosyltransferase involved in cell wall biosynthesis
MNTPDRNAAIWYAQDGFDPKAKGINGRRVAGESFLRGFLRHAQVDEFALLAKNDPEVAPVRALAAELRPDVPVRSTQLLRPHRISPVQTIFYPSPNFVAEAWRRAPHGTGAWSLCGITHTTSTAAVMQGWFDMAMGPVFPWDAVICTSHSVLASTTHTFSLIDDHFRRQFRANPPPRPMLPVIPLGIHADDFTPSPAARADLRASIGAGPNDVVFATIARLTPHEKFDPLPIFIAMQKAQAQLPDRKLHIVFCGLFREDYSRKVFTEGAAKLMPDCGFHLRDGASATDRHATLSGADVFMFLIDNIQETFGLAPLEGMAAGLPLLVSDWDGMKDTVTPEVGFRIPTRMASAELLAPEALRYQGQIDNYLQYCSNTSAMTEIDMPALIEAVLTLARNPDLRARMGQAGLARVRAHFDWAQVVPQMQDLWAEQDRIRRAQTALHRRYSTSGLPIAPSPGALFASYPTEPAQFGPAQFAVNLGHPPLEVVLEARNYMGVGRIFADAKQISAVLAALTARTSATHADVVADQPKVSSFDIERILIWLLKYDFIRRL